MNIRSILVAFIATSTSTFAAIHPATAFDIKSTFEITVTEAERFTRETGIDEFGEFFQTETTETFPGPIPAARGFLNLENFSEDVFLNPESVSFSCPTFSCK